MTTLVHTAALVGIDGFMVDVECFATSSIPRFDIVGLPDTAVKEAYNRIKAAIISSNLDFPVKSITVNLAPADIAKQGTSYDLAILVALLKCNVIKDIDISDSCFVGEVSLNGNVRRINGVLSMCLAAKQAGFSKIFVPAENAREASVVEQIEVYPVTDVNTLVCHILKGDIIKPESCKREELFDVCYDSLLDFADVKGQEHVKKAVEIAAAGMHNICLIGPPGTGKSMIAKRIPGILPPMNFDEALETTKVYSASGCMSSEDRLITKRPFRAPHHTMSSAGLVGGGRIPCPGEISLSHNGVLFLDELPEFDRSATDGLRQPLEDGCVTITRVSGKFKFPSKFMLVCAMNPCKCGFYGHPTRECTCTKLSRDKYLSKVSGPLLDRIDIQVEVPSLTYEKISEKIPSESSEVIRERVCAAREIMNKRYEGTNIHSNSELTASMIRKYCVLDDDANELLKGAFERLGLSARGYDRVLKVARTVADMEKSEIIRKNHIALAVQLRSLDRKYWG